MSDTDYIINDQNSENSNSELDPLENNEQIDSDNECKQQIDVIKETKEDENGEENNDHPLIYLDEDTLKLNEHFEERIRSLQKTMLNLKQSLTEEKEAWKREVEELAQLQEENRSDYNSYSSPCISDTDSDKCFISPEPILSDSLIDYEQKLNVYQSTLQAAQREKRYQIRRQLAATAYKRRLLEVENMCNLELLRVKQSVQFLQPLQQIAAEWDFHSDSAGDASSRFTTNRINTNCFNNSDLNFMDSIYSGVNELNYLPPECIGSRLYDEMTKMAKNINEPILSNKKDVLVNTDEIDDDLIDSMVETKSDTWLKENENPSPTNTVTSLL